MVQGMFGKPMKKPNDTNALHMLWTYHIYNGNPNTKDPFDTMLTVHNSIKGDRQTLGMLTQYCPH